MRAFTEDEVVRYARHIILPLIGGEGQRKLLDASVLCVGAGGLGSPIAMYLAAAGVGKLGVVDFDRVDLTNLQRQILHGTSDVGRPKVASAASTLRELNPGIEVVPHDTVLTSDNAFEVLRGYDIVIDGSDNFPVRYLVNDATQFLGRPLVYGPIYQFQGQATEAIKLITGIGDPLVGRLLIFDALEMDFTSVKIKRDPACPVCGDSPTVTELIDYDQFCGIAPGGVPEEAEHGVPTAVGGQR